ncbi:MAG: ABC transporter ATP-binding protein [Clostridia bacterium]|nr:ABC transporter ATP-binding protein [Clostridia bacterium]
MSTVINFLTTVFLRASSDQGFFLVLGVLYTIGLWKIFTKCGIKGWWALIPCAREELLGRAANRAEEGRVAAVTQGISILVEFIKLFSPDDPASAGRFTIFLNIMDIVVSLVFLMYCIRIYIGLAENFGRKKIWVLLWTFADGIAAFLWGFLKKYQPQWTVKELSSEAADFFSGSKASVMDQGLTVNLEERTATEAFKKKYLLRDIHMYIQPGHMVLLLGGSGAGKTTFLNAVNGYEKAKAEVMLNGSNMYKEYSQMKYDIGFVPQLDLMRGSDSVYRTLIDAATLRLPKSFTRAERQARVEEVMKIFGLTPVKDNLVSKLSGGQRKRLSIAMEFISNPSLFILDEPDSGLDGVMARELFQQLRQIADQGKIIIVITHTPDRVIDLFDDVIVLAKDMKRTGRLAFFGPIEEARTFFGKEKMEEIVKSINREEEGGEGRADEFILKYAEVQHG